MHTHDIRQAYVNGDTFETIRRALGVSRATVLTALCEGPSIHTDDLQDRIDMRLGGDVETLSLWLTAPLRPAPKVVMVSA